MARYVEGLDRHQVTLLPECLEDYIADEQPSAGGRCVRRGTRSSSTGLRAGHSCRHRPAYHPAVLLNIYIYGYLKSHRVQQARAAQPAQGAVVVRADGEKRPKGKHTGKGHPPGRAVGWHKNHD